VTRSLKIAGFSHIGFAVDDIEAFQNTWGQLLGMTDWRTKETTTASGLQLHGSPVDGVSTARTATAKIGGTAFELVQPVTGPIHHGEHLERFGPSVHHLAFWVHDLVDEAQRLPELGWEIGYSSVSLPGALRERPVSATVTNPAAADLASAAEQIPNFFAFIETAKPVINCTIELLDVGFAEQFRQSFGSHTYYPGDLPG
jgi:catechol 2,3-dioxygenase-like lactoylglutathione lyase family enzyme